jgi:hypothetical protein
MRDVERFPFTIPVAAAYLYCFLSLNFLQIEATSKNLLQVTAEINFLQELLIGGPVILLVTALAFTRSTQMLRPVSLVSRWDPKQAILIIAGLGLTSVFQLYVNQLTIGPFIGNLAPQSAFAFKTDAAIAEESFFNAVGIMLYVFFRLKGKFGRYASIGLSTIPTAIIFMYFHNTDIAYAAIPQALLFVLGLRVIINPIVLYTHSLFSGIAIHWPWNAVS